MWHFKKFDELTTRELHSLYMERMKVFIVEQQSPFLDADENDLISTHIFKVADGKVIANARIFETEEGALHIGSILVREEYRGKGLSRELLDTALNYIDETYPEHEIEMNAEVYIKKLYASYGFREVAEPKIRSGIAHVWMKREPAAALALAE